MGVGAPPGKILDPPLVLDKLVAPYQTGFMEGRNMLTNIIKLMEILQDSQRQQIAAIVMSIDFEKCFDMIEHLAIESALRLFFHKRL